MIKLGQALLDDQIISLIVMTGKFLVFEIFDIYIERYFFCLKIQTMLNSILFWEFIFYFSRLMALHL